MKNNDRKRSICRVAAKLVEDGDIILLHDMSDSSVEAALVIVDELLEEGFRFVTVSQLAEAKGEELLPGEDYYHFRK